MMSVSLCIHCWCGRFCCWWHGSQSVDLHPLVMLIHIYQRSPFCILCLYAPSLYRHGGLRKLSCDILCLGYAHIKHCTYMISEYTCIYNLSNITCHYHKFGVRNRSRLHIMRVWHPRQRAGIAIACPVDSLAHRATASCTPIVHPPSWQPGPSGNRQLHAHWAPAQLPAWPIGQPPAERPLCTRPAASLAHRATASWTPIVHPPSCQPGPSGNRQLHDHSAPPAASLAHRATASWTPIAHPPSCQPGPSGNRQLHAQLTPIGHPPSCQPGPSGNRQLHARLTLSCTVNSRAAPGPPFSAHASTPLPSPLELMTYQPPFPPHHRWRRNQDASV